MKLRKHLRSLAQHAEWHEKVIHYFKGPPVQQYALTLLLPVPVNCKDKSPEAALERYLKQVGKA